MERMGAKRDMKRAIPPRFQVAAGIFRRLSLLLLKRLNGLAKLVGPEEAR